MSCRLSSRALPASQSRGTPQLAARGESSAELGLARRDALALLALHAAMVVFTLWTLGR
jgi:hypothetical protein